MTVLTDEELAVRALGDTESFGELYDRYVASVYRFVRGRIGDHQAAEDVTAETFFKALRGIGGFRPQGNTFRAWLFQIAVNAAIDHLRGRKVTVNIDGLREQPGQQMEVADQVVQRHEAARVYAALTGLAPDQRTAVTLRLAGDLSNREVAMAMRRSEGAVKVLIHRGLSTLRQRLQSLDETREQEARV